MALINPVLPVAPIISDATAYQSAQNEPMQIPQDGEEDVLTGKGIRIFLVEKREVVILIVVGHGGY
jgi:hypothetical protein